MATFTPVTPNPSEDSLFDVLNNLFGSDYFRISDDSDHYINGTIISGPNILYNSGAASNNVPFLLPQGPDKTSVCINTSFSWTHDSCSDPTLNKDGEDYVVTFGLQSNPNTFILAFEDWAKGDRNPSGGYTDLDYDDLVVQVTVRDSDNPVVPEPTTGLLLGAALIGVGLVRKLKKKNLL